MRGTRKRTSLSSDRKINKKNTNLIIDKILSYNPTFQEGIITYKEANNDFLLLLFVGTILIDFPLISLPCCILAMYYIIKVFKFIKYKSINKIVIELARDLSLKGIYDKEKAESMIREFKEKYGREVREYEDLVTMLNKYEAFVTRIEYVLNNIKESKGLLDEDVYSSGNQPLGNNNCSYIYEKNEYKKSYGTKVSSYYKNDKNPIFFEKENGEVKKVNKAIEFFEHDDKVYDNPNTVILKNMNKNSENLTIYLYKKTPDLQKSVL